MRFNIIISGVGGQGTVLASRVLATAAMEKGFFVRTAETIGMAQRGGSVISFVRIDSEKAGPIVPMGVGDLLLGFELAEAVRCLPRLNRQGRCIVNSQTIEPVPVSIGKEKYDREAITASIVKQCPRHLFINAPVLAQEAGSVRAVNSVMLGASCGFGQLPFSEDEIETALKQILPERLWSVNIKAFRMGLAKAKKDRS
jgi:indolepyruvate ferredoxin oxidoreductase beta subunit